MSDVLDAELSTFEAHRQDLVAKAKGQIALVHGDEIVGVFANEEDALIEGYTRFGNAAFLVKEITEVDVPVDMMSIVPGT